MDILKNIISEVTSSLGNSGNGSGLVGNISSMLGGSSTSASSLISNLFGGDSNTNQAKPDQQNGAQPDAAENQGGLNLDDMIGKLTSGGFGNVISSWIGTGQNQSLDGNDLSKVFSSAQLASIARKLGIDNNQVLEFLPKLLPAIVDKLTPDGKLPEGGLQGKLSSLLKNITG